MSTSARPQQARLLGADPRRRRDGRLILDPDEFYILASRSACRCRRTHAAEMVPIDPMMGEFRAHYAGFFDPGFGPPEAGPAPEAVLEVRTLEVPFILDDGQAIARLSTSARRAAQQLYGHSIGSHYQGQGLKLSKALQVVITEGRAGAGWLAIFEAVLCAETVAGKARFGRVPAQAGLFAPRFEWTKA